MSGNLRDGLIENGAKGAVIHLMSDVRNDADHGDPFIGEIAVWKSQTVANGGNAGQ
jgi:hypothetical protein